MTARRPPHCVILPCSADQAWAVPQACLGEIVTVPADAERPPESIHWRGGELPILDLGAESGQRWCDARGGSGLVAVMLGLAPGPGGCWGLAVASEGLAMLDLREVEIEDEPEAVAERSSAAFSYRDSLYQVPDLRSWQAFLVDSNPPIEHRPQ